GFVYGPDMFGCSDGNGAGRVTLQREADPDYPGEYNLKVGVNTVDNSIAVTDNYNIQTHIEGWNFGDFMAGSATPQTFTFSFEVKCTFAGTFYVAFKNDGVNRSYVVPFTINAANTVERKTMTVTCDTTGTWDKTTSAGLYITFSLAHGSNYQAAAPNVWNAGNFFTITGATTNFMSSTANVLRIKRVKLEKGTVATAFERRPYIQELLLCQRYYWKTFTQGSQVQQAAGG